MTLWATTEAHKGAENVGRGHSLNELLHVVAEVVGEQPKVGYLPARTLDVPENVLDIGWARKHLGWSPKVGLREGIARVWEGIFSSPENEAARP